MPATRREPESVPPTPRTTAVAVAGESPVRRVSATAIVGAALVAVATLLLLNLLGLGLGLTTIDPAPGGETSPSASTFGIVSGIWTIAATVIALFVGGLVAGRLAENPNRTDAMLHGLVTWALTMVVVVWMIGSAAGTLVGGASSALGSVASGLAQTTGAAASGGAGLLDEVPWNRIEQRVDEALPADVELDRQALVDAARSFLVEGGDRQAVVDILVQQGGLSPQEAESAVDTLTREYEQATQEAGAFAGEIAETTADVAAQAALWSVFAFALAAAAAAIGGLLGAPRHLAHRA